MSIRNSNNNNNNEEILTVGTLSLFTFSIFASLKFNIPFTLSCGNVVLIMFSLMIFLFVLKALNSVVTASWSG